MLTSTAFNEAYYREHQAQGLDYLNYGDWQREYGEWLVESLNWRGVEVLDAGCACGSIANGLHRAGALVTGVDCCEHMIRLGRERFVPRLLNRLHVCDVANLHLFSGGVFGGIHCAQVAEHWRPRLVTPILTELRRVATPGALFFCALDTTELFTRQHRHAHGPGEDPTHWCVRPMDWWHRRLIRTGWEMVDFDARLRVHKRSYLVKYDWSYWVARARELSQSR